MKKLSPLPGSGFTLVEIAVGITILTVVGGIAYSILSNSTLLLAKNISINSSNTTVRSSLDRIYSEISQANGMPQLINADGSSASGTGPAAGVVFDRYRGGPYLVTNPGSNGLPASATSIDVKLSTDPLALPPIPAANDVLCVGSNTVRPLVASSSPAALAPSPPAVQSVTVTLKAKLGQSIPWSASVQETAFLVHREAIVVVPSNGRNELRIYPDVETTSNSCSLATTYRVLSRDIANKSGDNTPFTIVTKDGANFISIAMRVEDTHYNQILASKQAKEFNTYLQVDAQVRPRNFL